MRPARLENCPTGTDAAVRPFTFALLLLVLSLAPAHAEVRTNSVAGSEDGRATLSYSTGAGANVSGVSGRGNYSYDPDGLAGHQFFHQTVDIDGTPVVTNGTADLTHGVLGADGAVDLNTINIGIGITSTKMQFLDTVTFSNSTGQPATITVNWKVNGSLTATEVQGSTQAQPGSHAGYQT